MNPEDSRNALHGALITLGFLILVVLLSVFNVGEGGDSDTEGEWECIPEWTHYGQVCS